MTNTELLALLRFEVSDEKVDYLWSDSFIYAAIDEAQKQFCRDSYGIADARSFTLAITVAGIWYALDPRILKVRSAIDQATGVGIDLVPVEKMSANNMRFDGSTGPLQALITGMDAGNVRAYPTPNIASTVELRVFRMSADMDVGDDFEIDAQHVRNLLLWVKHRAYGVQDSEVYNPKKSEEFRVAFKAYCDRALQEQSRLNHSAGTVAYGGL